MPQRQRRGGSVADWAPGEEPQSGSIVERKARARTRLRQINRSRIVLEREAASRALCERLKSSALWERSESVLFFYPLASEPDILPLLRMAMATGKRGALPRHVSGSDTYEPVWIRDLESELIPGAYGIPEPSAECPSVSKSRLDLILVPGVGFDLAFGRLGRGRGHYDRLLISQQGLKCGVCFDWQLERCLPAEAHDVSLDYLVTPSQLLRRTSGSEKCS